MDFSVNRRVEFRDTDAAGIVHFSAFFPMMEAAEHELLRSLGITILPAPASASQENASASQENASASQRNQDVVTWPRVAAHCDYVSAARFEDLLRIGVQVAKIGSSSVQYRFRFTRDHVPVAVGTMTAVCCQLTKDASTGETHLKKAAIPDSVRNLLNRYLAVDES